jgi:hypothetical protein
MRRIMMMVTVALVTAMMMVAMAMPAFAAPQSANGTCGVGGPSDNGASGCAGNEGGDIITENQGCREINRGPFHSEEEFCPNSGSRVSIGPAIY